MTNPNDPSNEPAQQSEEGPGSLTIGIAMIGGIGVLMLIGYFFR